MQTGGWKMRRFAIAVAWSTVCLNTAPRNARCAELKPETVAAFNLYVQVSEAQMDADIRAGRFLLVDSLPEAQRQQAYAQLQHGDLYIKPQRTLQAGRAIRVPSGLIHHWAGAIFIRGATLKQVNSVLKDFDNAPNIFKPELQQFRVLGRDGEGLKAFIRVYYKSIITVTYNVLLDLHEAQVENNRILTRCYSTRVAQVHDPAGREEHELPVGKDYGFMWRLYTCWHLEGKDGGVYVEIEAVSLSRGIPAVFAPLVKPLTESIPRNILTDLLTDTRMAVRSAGAEYPSVIDYGLSGQHKASLSAIVTSVLEGGRVLDMSGGVE
jgi:hypothetical protein